MKDIKFRVDDPLHSKLQDLAAREGEPTSVLVRRYVRRGVQADTEQRPEMSLAHEGIGRVR